ncbi:MAG: succinate dehydrogenase/fumarate reductase iron-sulfur subunit [Elusimicrobia bacterium]|nr:MAG: succinate dehydrogenase/fumarate reductase iron-sulfur subunit [Elusimicrobiota bacterium]
MNLTLRVWRQKDASSEGQFETYEAQDISPDQSFLEMLDAVNEDLIVAGKAPIAFDHDCREGICGTCSLVIDGRAHGPDSGKTTCSLHMRRFSDGDNIVIEPFRAKAFPVVRDLVTDRSSFDRIIQSGGYISVKTGSAVEANAMPVPKENSDLAMDAAACIGCGACVAACPNASAMLFIGAKVSQMALLPQGQPEREQRVLKMVDTHDAEGFGNCTNEYECMKACPKEIDVANIARLNREYLKATITTRD